MKIDTSMIESAYFYAKKVRTDEITRNEGKERTHDETGMEIGSAQDYITVFLDMMEGNEYKRTINTAATRYYFDNIQKDFGLSALISALNAAKAHTKYYATLGHGSLRGIERLIDEFESLYLNLDSNS